MEEETDNGNQRGKNYLLPNHSKLYSSSLCLELSQHVKNLSRKRISKKIFHRHITVIWVTQFASGCICMKEMKIGF